MVRAAGASSGASGSSGGGWEAAGSSPAARTPPARGAGGGVEEELAAIYHALDRNPAVCELAEGTAGRYAGRLWQDAALLYHSPVLRALAPEGKGSSDRWWRLLEQAATSNPGCGAAVGCLLGLAIGDAVGHPLEFTPVDQGLPGTDGYYHDPERPCLVPGTSRGSLRYKNAYNKFELRPGQWTDDTSMALCLADSLLVHGGYNGGDLRVRWHMWWTHGYCNAFRYDTAQRTRCSVGLGGNISKSLSEVERLAAGLRTSAAADAVPPFFASARNDAGNGSIMRLAPVPIAYHLSAYEGMEVATWQSLATHPGAEAACCCCFLAYFITHGIEAHRDGRSIWEQPQVFIQEVVDTFLGDYDPRTGSASRRAGLEGFWEDAGDLRTSTEALQRLCCLLACQPPGPKEQNWHWKARELAIRQAIDCRTFGSDGRKDPDATYNGHPVIPGYFGAYCMDGLAMALWAVWHSRSFSECITRVVNLLGDADTTGAIAGQMAGVIYGWRGLASEEWGQTCLRNLRSWDPFAEIGLRAALLYHHYPRPTVELRQAEGFRSVRVFEAPRDGAAMVGEIPTGTQVTVVDQCGHFFRVLSASLEGWVGRKNTVYLRPPRPQPLGGNAQEDWEGMAPSSGVRDHDASTAEVVRGTPWCGFLRFGPPTGARGSVPGAPRPAAGSEDAL